MPGTVDQGAEPATVHVLTEEPFEVPSEPELEDAQASAMLAALFINYKQLKRARPKFPAESKVMPAIISNPESISEMINESVDKFNQWVSDCTTLLLSIQDVGDANPGANVHIVGRDGRSIQTNGTKLFEALLRTEAQLLGGNLASAG